MGSKQLNFKSVGVSHPSTFYEQSIAESVGRYTVPNKSAFAPLNSGILNQPSISVKGSNAVSHSASDSVPPARPKFLEPTHFFTSLDATQIREQLQQCSKELNFDQSKASATSSQWSEPWTSYRQHASVDFWISIYSDTQSPQPRLVIELQRTSGCGAAFNEAVRGLRQKLDDRCLIELPPKRDWSAKIKASAAKRAQSCPALVQLETDQAVFRSLQDEQTLPPFQPLSPEEITRAAAEHVANALHMLESQYYDARGEGMRCIADLTLQPNAQQALISTCNTEKDSIAIMVNTLDQNQEDLHRCAASALANMLSSDLVAQARVRVQTANGHTKLLDLICRSDTPQVLREAARALVGFGADNLSALCQETESQEKHDAAVRKLQQHSCPRVQQYGASLQKI
jgi:hypothetical protein